MTNTRLRRLSANVTVNLGRIATLAVAAVFLTGFLREKPKPATLYTTYKIVPAGVLWDVTVTYDTVTRDFTFYDEPNSYFWNYPGDTSLPNTDHSLSYVTATNTWHLTYSPMLGAGLQWAFYKRVSSSGVGTYVYDGGIAWDGINEPVSWTVEDNENLEWFPATVEVQLPSP